MSDKLSSMKHEKTYSDTGKTNFFKMLLELCDLGNESLLIEHLTSAEEELDCRYLTEMNYSEFLRYCIVLVENGECEELKRLLTGKMNKSVSRVSKSTNVITLRSFKKAI